MADGEGFRDVDGRSRRGGAVIFRVKVDADVLPFDIVLHHTTSSCTHRSTIHEIYHNEKNETIINKGDTRSEESGKD